MTTAETNRTLAQRARQISRDLESANTDDECEAALAALHELAPRAEDKLLADAHVLRAIKSDIERQAVEAEYFFGLAAGHKAQIRRLTARLDWLRGCTLGLLQSYREATGTSGPFRLAWGGSLSSTTSRSVEVDVTNMADLPAECIDIRPHYAAIRAAHKAGRVVPGATCRTTERQSLTFREPTGPNAALPEEE